MADQNEEPANPIPPGHSAGYRFERYASYFALAFSIIAISLTVVELRLTQAQQRAEVWPYLQLDTSYSSEGMQITLKNKGVGPARVESVKLTIDSREVDDIEALIARVMPADQRFSYDVYSSSNPDQSVIASGENVTLFSIPWEERTRLFSQNLNNRFAMQICFCSIYDECWITELDDGKPQNVAACS